MSEIRRGRDGNARRVVSVPSGTKDPTTDGRQNAFTRIARMYVSSWRFKKKIKTGCARTDVQKNKNKKKKKFLREFSEFYVVADRIFLVTGQ